MRLLLLGGFAQSLLNFRGALIEDLIRAGVEVHVAAPGLVREGLDHALRARGAIPHDISLRRTGMNPVADFGTVLGLWRLMAGLRPDAFLGYTIKPVIYGLLAAWLAGVRRRYALITGLGYAFQDRPAGVRARLVSGLARSLYRLALRRADLVFFQNPDDEALFRDLGILRQQAPSRVVNGSGVDVAYFGLSSLPSGKMVFLMIARLLGAKGVREFARAALVLRAAYPEAVFRLAGWLDEGPDAIRAEELENWVESGALEYLGRLDDVRPALRACTVYVLPSYREGTPRTVLEAMAVGRPVITTDAPGCRETVADGLNGFLVPVGSSDSLADAMRRFLEDPGLVPAMAMQSRQIAEQKYDVRQVNAAMLQGMGIGS